MLLKEYEVYKFQNEKISLGTECFNDILVEVEFGGYLTQEWTLMEHYGKSNLVSLVKIVVIMRSK